MHWAASTKSGRTTTLSPVAAPRGGRICFAASARATRSSWGLGCYGARARSEPQFRLLVLLLGSLAAVAPEPKVEITVPPLDAPSGVLGCYGARARSRALDPARPRRLSLH